MGRTWGYADKAYSKTMGGFIVRLYCNMKGRVCGRLPKKNHLYKGLDILPKEEFYDWIKNNNTFIELFEAWKENDMDRRLVPSIDRIDSSKGYTLDNIRIVTFSENCKHVRTKKEMIEL